MLRNSLQLAVLSLCIGTFADRASAESGINLIVEGVRNEHRNILVLVFDNAAGFETLNYETVVDIAEIKAQSGSVRYTFGQLNEGPYAIFLFHDENGDDDLNTKGGRLLEGIGATGAPNRNDEPDFMGASVMPGNVTVRLHYDQ
ncbi:DUF2141 domain-containing protein [Sulfitobacter pacificus]|uniref:DUF2141 domain-containing protein n=1 Tax=Sulfitobacter pacificus TaxID=1499314 RepID=A0ABQ5VLD7_9RHOB|nr:DUF2141 domain-containing protein [Sulfitobacter pacificus]GLQ27958.1 hypothetical protein GCM10007927_27610 [Sulfitobacter pacificus]